MAERITLAQFARNLGIAPATARQWKKRGKIVEVEGGYELIAEAQRHWIGLPIPASGESERLPPVVRPRITAIDAHDGIVTVTSQWEEVKQPESVTKIASTEPWPYEPLPLVTDCPVCHGARWACGHTPIEDLTQIELLTKDNRILSQAVDSLRDLTTELSATLSQALKRIEALENPGEAYADAVTSALGKSNYTGSAASVGERFDDAPAPGIVW